MMPPDAVKILGQVQDSKFNDDSTVVQLIRVTFKVGPFGPFTETFNKDTFSAAARDDKLQAFARNIWVDPPTV